MRCLGSTKLFVEMFLLLLLPVAALAGPAQTIGQTLTISLFNDANVPPLVLTQAQARASGILAHAGINVLWMSCAASAASADQFPPPSPCASIAFPTHLSVRLIPGNRVSNQDTFGQAFQDASGKGAYANVFYAHLTASNTSGFLAPGDMLGYVIAHEVGHLLLGLNSHSPAGVMCPRWSRDQLNLASRSSVYFTSAQGTLMRSRLADSAPSLAASRDLTGSRQ